MKEEQKIINKQFCLQSFRSGTKFEYGNCRCVRIFYIKQNVQHRTFQSSLQC